MIFRTTQEIIYKKGRDGVDYDNGMADYNHTRGWIPTYRYYIEARVFFMWFRVENSKWVKRGFTFDPDHYYEDLSSQTNALIEINRTRKLSKEKKKAPKAPKNKFNVMQVYRNIV